MSHVDMLSSQEQNILVWVAEAEIGVDEPLAVSVADLPYEQVNATVDRLVVYGLLSRESIGSEHGSSSLDGLNTSLTTQGARVVVELWRRRLRELPNARLTA